MCNPKLYINIALNHLNLYIMDTKELVKQITNHLNTFGDKSEEFNKAMSNEHRTLQQNFTRLCLAWIEHCASDEYYYDGRNEASHNTSKAILEGFEKVQREKGYDGEFLKFMSKLSGHLPLV